MAFSSDRERRQQTHGEIFGKVVPHPASSVGLCSALSVKHTVICLLTR
jgi:hypothetical protein